MDKLMTLDFLWDKRDSLEGKVVTINLDTVNTVANGTTGMIKGCNYYCVYFGVNINKLGIEWKDIKAHLEKNNIIYNKKDTLQLGYYGINIINRVDKEVTIPDWINYNKTYLQFDRRTDIYPAADSPLKYITGVIVHSNSGYNGNNEIFSAYIESRKITIFPLGIMYMETLGK